MLEVDGVAPRQEGVQGAAETLVGGEKANHVLAWRAAHRLDGRRTRYVCTARTPVGQAMLPEIS